MQPWNGCPSGAHGNRPHHSAIADVGRSLGGFIRNCVRLWDGPPLLLGSPRPLTLRHLGAVLLICCITPARPVPTKLGPTFDIASLSTF
jgi:hypothetical protein